MIYRNKRTGAVVDFCSEIKGGPWELVAASRSAEDLEPKPAPKVAQKNRAQKKTESKK